MATPLWQLCQAVIYSTIHGIAPVHQHDLLDRFPSLAVLNMTVGLDEIKDRTKAQYKINEEHF